MAKIKQMRLALHSKIPYKKKCDLVVSNILGPVDPADIFGNQYILTLWDHETTFFYCFSIKTCAEVETKLTNALDIIKNQAGAPTYFCCDNAK